MRRSLPVFPPEQTSAASVRTSWMCSRLREPCLLQVSDHLGIGSIAGMVSGQSLAGAFKMHSKSDLADFPVTADTPANSELHAPPANGADGHTRPHSSIGSGNAFSGIKRNKDLTWVAIGGGLRALDFSHPAARGMQTSPLLICRLSHADPRLLGFRLRPVTWPK